MKKLVTLLCALVLCLSVFNVASACGKYPDNYIASPTGDERYRSINATQHQMAVEFAEICSKCGQFRGYTYVYTGDPFRHRSGGERYNYHSGGRHYFYSSCTVCYGQYNKKSGLCPGSDTIPHITEVSAQSIEVCLQ